MRAVGAQRSEVHWHTCGCVLEGRREYGGGMCVQFFYSCRGDIFLYLVFHSRMEAAGLRSGLGAFGKVVGRLRCSTCISSYYNLRMLTQRSSCRH